MTETRYSGKELKLLRVAADVRANRLAEAMGVTGQRISYLEGRDVVTTTAAARYLEALTTCVTNHTSEAA